MKTFLTSAALAAAMFTGAANAATIYATSATIVTDGPRGTDHGRSNIDNALGDATGDFFELGRGATVDFTFGQMFTGPLTLLEVTFGNVVAHPESATILGGLGGVFTELTSVRNDQAQGDGFTFNFAGVYDTLRFIDTTTFAGSGGFDVDRIGVEPVLAAVPLPAAGLLLAGALGGLGAVRRRKSRT